jgi:nucleoside-diphosphate-sugar epimerase
MKVAIFGAGGAIGSVLVPELAGRGHQVRVVGRDAAKLAPLAGPAVSVLAADLADPLGAHRAAEGVDAVVYAVGVPYDRFAEHPRLIRIALEAARDAGVRQFVLISTVYPYGRARTATVAETHPREPHTVKGRYRKEQADLVLAEHDPAALSTLVLVLPDFYGPTAELSYAKEIFDAALSGKTANVIAPLDVPHEFAFVPDVAPVLADLLERPDAFGRSYNLGGAGTITTRDFITLAERASGTRIRTLAANKTLLRLLGTFNPLLREMVEMHYLFTSPVVLDDALLHSVLPHIRKTPYETGIAQTVAARRARRGAAHV